MDVKTDVENTLKRINERPAFKYTHNAKLKSGVAVYLKQFHSEDARLFVLTASPHSVTDAYLNDIAKLGATVDVFMISLYEFALL